MTKKEYEKQEKRNKVKTILKWVLVGLGWTALTTAFVCLIALGVKGCNNKGSKANAQTEYGVVTTPLQLNNKVVAVDDTQGYFNNPDTLMEQALQSVAGYTQDGTSSLRHTWVNDGNSYAPWRMSAMPAFNLQLTDNTTLYRLFTLSLTDSDNVVADYNVYRVTQTTNNDGVVTFYYYNNGSYGSVDIYDQDFDYDVYNKVEITFPAYNYDWAMTSNDYVVEASLTYYNYSSTYWVGMSDYHAGSFQPMFRLGQYYVGNYGWNSRTQVISSNEAGGDTSGGGSIDGNSNVLYGVFSLLAMAFNTIASIMAISIIPGVTIGTLIILPLVVTIILLIVHLFKR